MIILWYIVLDWSFVWYVIECAHSLRSVALYWVRTKPERWCIILNMGNLVSQRPSSPLACRTPLQMIQTYWFFQTLDFLTNISDWSHSFVLVHILWSVLWKHLWVQHLRVLFWIKVWTHTGVEVFPTLVKYVNIFAKVMRNSVLKTDVAFSSSVFASVVVLILFEHPSVLLGVSLGL